MFNFININKLTLTQFVTHNCHNSMHFSQCCSYVSCCIVLGVSRGQSQSQSPRQQHDRSQSSRQFGHFDAVLSANSTRRGAAQLTHSPAAAKQSGSKADRRTERETEEGRGSWSARGRGRGRGEACYHKIGVNELQSPF